MHRLVAAAVQVRGAPGRVPDCGSAGDGACRCSIAPRVRLIAAASPAAGDPTAGKPRECCHGGRARHPDAHLGRWVQRGDLRRGGHSQSGRRRGDRAEAIRKDRMEPVAVLRAGGDERICRGRSSGDTAPGKAAVGAHLPLHSRGRSRDDRRREGHCAAGGDRLTGTPARTTGAVSTMSVAGVE